MRHRKNLRVALATSVTLVAGTLATVAVTASPAQAAPNVTINLVGINDFHGRIDANTVKWAGTVEQLKASAPNPLVVGAGDLIGASTFASAVANDEPTIDVMNTDRHEGLGGGQPRVRQGLARPARPGPRDRSARRHLEVPRRRTSTRRAPPRPVLPEYAEFDHGGTWTSP